MPRPKGIPHFDELIDYKNAVAGHAGTMCDRDGTLFVKPCTQDEVDFYNSAKLHHPKFAALMPVCYGELILNPGADPKAISAGVSQLLADAVNDASDPEHPHGIHIAVAGGSPTERAAELAVAKAAAQVLESVLVPAPAAVDAWKPNHQNKIMTNLSVVLENATYGYKRPNVLDIKLGARLWADDAPADKKARFDKISAVTTSGTLGFRVAGMRVWQGSAFRADGHDLDSDGYKVFDKDYGRTAIRDDNVVNAFKQYIVNQSAGVDKPLGRAIAEAFLTKLRHVQDVLENHESRMYSGSLLFIYEGDGDTLWKAIKEGNRIQAERDDAAMVARGEKGRTTTRVDSGISMVNDDVDSDSDSDSDSDEDDMDDLLPKICTLRLIDFAHAKWVPGQGPDENLLHGVRNLVKIFEELST